MRGVSDMPVHEGEAAIHEWLTCPVCRGEGEQITIGADCEHVWIHCEHCGSQTIRHHGAEGRWEYRGTAHPEEDDSDADAEGC